jgi:hypothetical protein
MSSFLMQLIAKSQKQTIMNSSQAGVMALPQSLRLRLG